MESIAKHNFLKMIVVEYSKSQNAFHRSTEEERVTNEAVNKSDYEVVDTFHSYKEADRFIEANYENIKEFGYYKNKNGELFIVE